MMGAFLKSGYLAVCLGLLLLSGCASSNYKPLSIEDRQKISSADVCIFLNQQEVNAEIRKSTVGASMGGGLLGALIDVAVDNHEAKSQESNLQPIRDSLIDLNFGQLLTEEIRKGAEIREWPRFREVNVFFDFTEEKLVSVIRNSTADSVLTLHPTYAFTPDFQALNVTSRTRLYGKNSITADGAPEPLYLNVMIALTRTEGNLGREEAVTYWSEDNAGRSRKALNHGVRELVRMVTYDLTSDIKEETKLADSTDDIVFPTVKVISSSDDCIITRNPLSVLRSTCR